MSVPCYIVNEVRVRVGGGGREEVEEARRFLMFKGFQVRRKLVGGGGVFHWDGQTCFGCRYFPKEECTSVWVCTCVCVCDCDCVVCLFA